MSGTETREKKLCIQIINKPNIAPGSASILKKN